jgi:hypothetical protein
MISSSVSCDGGLVGQDQFVAKQVEREPGDARGDVRSRLATGYCSVDHARHDFAAAARQLLEDLVECLLV